MDWCPDTGSETAVRVTKRSGGLMSFATDRDVVSLLVRMRLSLKRKRREFGFFHRIALSQPGTSNTATGLLSGIFPPRRQWPRPNADRRRLSAKRGTDASGELLIAYIMRQWGTPKSTSPAWLKALRKLSGQIRRRIAAWDENSQFAAPSTAIKLKALGKGKGDNDEFRGLAVYPIEDRVVISIVAKYWRSLTNDLMHPGSIVFRTEVPPLTHHDAVKRLLSFREKWNGQDVWVSEVDIRGFFDVIRPSVALQATDEFTRRLLHTPDLRAVAILRAFLNSYSFNKLGRREAQERALKRKRTGFGVAVPWPEKELRSLGVDIENEDVGIPQGGALSCFLANVVLDKADRAVQRVIEEAGANDSALYCRYCDDIICLATSPAVCERMMQAYSNAVQSLGLPIHAAQSFVGAYRGENRSTFWDSKSKAPYLWGAPQSDARVPWCSFVGYQVRHDGALRVRPKSIKKEVEKQNFIETRVLRDLQRYGQKRTHRQVLYRVRQRLKSIAVGIKSGGQSSVVSQCWVNGFRLLRGRHSSATQLRDLDRHRVSTLKTIRHRLVHLKSSVRTKHKERVLRFEGFPFSYAQLGFG